MRIAYEFISYELNTVLVSWFVYNTKYITFSREFSNHCLLSIQHTVTSLFWINKIMQDFNLEKVRSEQEGQTQDQNALFFEVIVNDCKLAVHIVYYLK